MAKTFVLPTLTNEEQYEWNSLTLSNRDLKNLPPHRITVRRAVAVKFWDVAVKVDTTITSRDTLAAYTKCPPWAFFTNKDEGIIRVYGVKTASKMHAIELDTVSDEIIQMDGGVEIDDLIQVPQWSREQFNQICQCKKYGQFFGDPLGMILILARFSKRSG